jgi:hypothetical protein
MKFVQCDLASSPLAQNIFLNEDSPLDPFQDWYLQTIFSMDKNALMRIPILDDKTFLKQLNEGVIDKKGESFSDNINMWMLLEKSICNKSNNNFFVSKA